jgi:magnesium transporter
MARTRLYRKGELVATDFPVAEISDHLADPESLVWLDLCLAEGDALHTVVDELALHELAVEDAEHEHERAKLDRYDSHLFLNASLTAVDPVSGELRVREVSAFITKQALVTVRRTVDTDLDPVLQRWDDSPELASHGVAFLLHGLLDHVVDSHFDAVHTLDDEIEGLEDLLFDDRPHDKQVQRRSFELRKSLVLLRRLVLPMREVVNTLMRRDLHVIDETMAPYFQDVYDHVLRATEWTESLRDLVSTILETNLTIQGNRMNLIMKKVTSWAAVIAVPTAVTGFYGQNVPYPGYGHWSGFVVSTAVMVLLSVGLFIAFKRRDWI